MKKKQPKKMSPTPLLSFTGKVGYGSILLSAAASKARRELCAVHDGQRVRVTYELVVPRKP